jgi:hypothetical protein
MPCLEYNNQRIAGEGSPLWTISGTPRAGMWTTRDTPGPGAYNADGSVESRIGCRIRDRLPTPRSLTADAEMPDCRRFPEMRATTIGEKDRKEFWDFDRAIPGPDFLPGSTLSRGALSIGEKRAVKGGRETPGPGDYNPANPAASKAPGFSCKGFGPRDQWLPKKNDMPGPAQYNIRKENDRPRWIIGERSISRTDRSTCSGREQLTSRRSARSGSAATGRQSK